MGTEKLNYYKSLVSDDEVIQALLKESKAREGEIEKTRIRPNINFLQRTLTNLVSTNTRLTKKQSEFKDKEKRKYERYPRKREPIRRKTHRQLINEFLSEKIEFVGGQDDTRNATNSCSNITQRNSSEDLSDVESFGNYKHAKHKIKHDSSAESCCSRLNDGLGLSKEIKQKLEHRKKKVRGKIKSQKQLINEILCHTKDKGQKSNRSVVKRKQTSSSETECRSSRTSLSIDSDSSDDIEIISVTPSNSLKPKKSASKQRNQIHMIRDILLEENKINNKKRKKEVTAIDSDSSDDVQIISITPPDVARIKYSKKK